MLESESLGMEHLARDVDSSAFYLDFGLLSISGVTQHRMADCREVYSNLMCPSGAELRLDKSRLIQPPEHSPASYRFLAAFCPCGHFFPIGVRAADGK